MSGRLCLHVGTECGTLNKHYDSLWVSAYIYIYIYTLLLEHEHGLWGSVDRERVGPLHRAATLTWHAVTASRVGKPQALYIEKHKFSLHKHHLSRKTGKVS